MICSACNMYYYYPVLCNGNSNTALFQFEKKNEMRMIIVKPDIILTKAPVFRHKIMIIRVS